MGDKKVSVILQAKDLITGVLKKSSEGVKGWSEGITKIAAGIGLADTFKEIGRAIKEAVTQAAEAYPKLAAPFKALGTTFDNFKIQAGAAILEALTPAVPLLTDILKWGTTLAQQLPAAIDGVKIVFVRLGGAIAELPDIGRQALGALLVALSEFVERAGTLLSLFGVDAGFNAADRLSAAGTALEQQGIKGRRATSAATDKRVGEIAGQTHDFGARAATDDEKKAREAREKALDEEIAALGKLAEAHMLTARDIEREQTLERQLTAVRDDGTRSVQERAKALERLAILQKGRRDEGSGDRNTTTSDRTRQGASAADQQAGIDAANRGGRSDAMIGAGGEYAPGANAAAAAGAFADAYEKALKPLQEFNAAFADTGDIFAQVVGPSLAGTVDAITGISDALAQSVPGFGVVGKAAAAAAKAIARIEGAVAIEQGSVKIFQSLFPPNPTGLAAGLGMVAHGAKLLAIGGSGGGSGGGGGTRAAGGLAPGTFQSDQQAAAQSRGSLTIVWPKGAFANPNDPAFQQLFADTAKEVRDRNVGTVTFRSA